MTIKDLETKITKEYKARIKELGLVKSGALYKSISTDIKVSDGQLKISINSMEYFVGLDERYKITDYVLNIVADDIVEVTAEEAFKTL
jgi:hypothetical protein